MGRSPITIFCGVPSLSKFASFHPGGPNVLARNAGGDASGRFHELHRPWVLGKYEGLVVGTVEGHKETSKTTGKR